MINWKNLEQIKRRGDKYNNDFAFCETKLTTT